MQTELNNKWHKAFRYVKFPIALYEVKMHKFILGSFCLFLLSSAGCGLWEDNKCLGTIYRSPSLYVTSGGTIYVSYYVKDKSIYSNSSCIENTANFSLVFAQSSDNGGSWTKKIIASEVLPQDTTEVMSQSMAVNAAGYIFVTYIDSGSLKCAVSKDYGATFTPVNLETATTVGGNSIMVDSIGNVYVAYNANGLKLKKYVAGNDAWDAAQIIDSTANTGFAPSLTVTGNDRIFISYYYRGNADTAGLKYATSSNGGSSWTKGNIKAGDDDVSGPLNWIISDTDNYIYVAFYDPEGYTGTNTNWVEKDTGVFKLAKSIDYGASWEITTVDSDSNTGKSVTIVPGMGGNYIYVCYGLLINTTEAYSTDNKIYCATSSNGGVTFGSPVQVDTGSYIDINDGGLEYLNLAMDFYNSNLYIVYSVTNSDGTTNLKLGITIDGLNWTKSNIY